MPEQSIYRDNAELYAAFCENNAPNSQYDRPAILRLAGDVTGKRVLELGCAAGVLTGQLVDRGAEVVALDREPRLVDIARRRLDTRARVEVADLEQPLTLVPTAGVDLVTASLVLHYIEDWAPLLAEPHRCLVPGGALVLSVHHPVTGWALSDQTDYHRVEVVRETWDWAGRQVTAELYRRPLSEIFGPLRRAGFSIDVVDEPRPQEGPDASPGLFEVLNTKPVFLFVRARRTDERPTAVR
ncbi:methyltransferase domain-containing protein [Actinosynnema sp. NPDC023587]|uniref:class I SAM-dependent methyltransferase n=1 Tax=Actinosynnema sp. NPDC023587 TaxID=3154695 RepID=UPI0033F7B44F